MDSLVDLAAKPLAKQVFFEERVFTDRVRLAWLLHVGLGLLFDYTFLGGRRCEFELW